MCRELKRLSSVTLSPVYAHFSETLSGVWTIRAFRATQRFMLQNQTRLDVNQRANYGSEPASSTRLLTHSHTLHTSITHSQQDELNCILLIALCILFFCISFHTEYFSCSLKKGAVIQFKIQMDYHNHSTISPCTHSLKAICCCLCVCRLCSCSVVRLVSAAIGCGHGGRSLLPGCVGTPFQHC